VVAARRADWSRRRNPPLESNEEAGYGFAYNPPYELSGTFYHGFGDKLDESKFEERPAGSFFTEPNGVCHFGMTKDEGAVLYFVGTGPSTNDDPEK
jgi:hypothetical protein